MSCAEKLCPRSGAQSEHHGMLKGSGRFDAGSLEFVPESDDGDNGRENGAEETLP